MNDPKHLFECTYPIPDKEIVYKKNPKHDVLVSNIGTVEDEFPYGRISTKQISSRPSLAGLIYETWKGKRDSSTDRIVHLNNNPYDFRPENLEKFRSIEDKEEKLRKSREFTRLTVEQMILREKDFCSCEEIKKRWKLLNIPKSYVSSWEVRSPLCRNNKAK